MTGEFPSQRANNAENVSIWLRHHDFPCPGSTVPFNQTVIKHLIAGDFFEDVFSSDYMGGASNRIYRSLNAGVYQITFDAEYSAENTGFLAILDILNISLGECQENNRKYFFTKLMMAWFVRIDSIILRSATVMLFISLLSSHPQQFRRDFKIYSNYRKHGVFSNNLYFL